MFSHIELPRALDRSEALVTRTGFIIEVNVNFVLYISRDCVAFPEFRDWGKDGKRDLTYEEAGKLFGNFELNP